MKTIQLSPPIATTTPNQFKIDLPATAGRGGFVVDTVRPGLQLAVADYQLDESSVFDYQFPEVTCGFGFCLEGVAESRIDCVGKEFYIKSGGSAFFSLEERTSGTDRVARGRMLRVSLLMNTNSLANIIGEGDDDFVATSIVQKQSCQIADVITPAMKVALYQILNCPYSGLIRQLFLEGKTMELLAYKLEQLRTNRPPDSDTHFLRSADIERVRHAANLLTCDLENPPDLTQLALSVGMSRSKLHRCFCQIYAQSPAEYLRNHRLQTAMLLLQEGQINVTEAAYSVGYASLSHFAKVFNSRYGVMPGELLKHSISVKNSSTVL